MDNTREFESVRAALSAWSVHSGRPAVWTEVEEVIESLTKVLGPVIRVHIPLAESYIGVTFEHESSKIGAYVGAGRIDHIAEIPGSYIPVAAPAYWRSELSTVGADSERSAEKVEIDLVVCPNGCGLKIRKSAECLCGWKFNLNNHQ